MKYSPSCYCYLLWLYQSCSLLICSLAILTSCSSDSVSARSNSTPHTLHPAAICHSSLQSNLVSRQGNHSSNQTTIDHVPHQEKSRHHSHLQQLERRVRLDQHQARRLTPQDDLESLVALHQQSPYNKHMYQILKNGKLLINADDLQTAVVYVRSLESNLNRLTQHSPYTIVKAIAPEGCVLTPTTE